MSSNIFICLVLLCTGSQAALWSYQRDETWIGLCQTGKEQSPIDIETASAESRTVEPLVFIRYNVPIKSTVINNGHSLNMEFDDECDSGIAGGDLGDFYKLHHVHFHWDAEHTIDGERLPLEVHFVHYNHDYPNITEAKDEDKGLAVISVLFHEDDEDNPDVEVVLDAMESEESDEDDDSKGNDDKDKNGKDKNGKDDKDKNGKDDKDKDGDGIVDDDDDDDDDDGATLNFLPSSLIPDDDDEFYRYEGSLTTPPCYESVIWTIMKDTIPVSKAQLERFKAINLTHSTHRLNYRPTQPINQREVELLTSEDDSSEKPADSSDEHDSAFSLSAPSSLLAFSSLVLFLIFRTNP